MTNPSGCFESNCFTVDVAGDKVTIRGADMQWLGCAVDTVEAFAVLRERFKAGDFDHIGQAQAVPS